MNERMKTYKDVESPGASVFGGGVEDSPAGGVGGEMATQQEQRPQHEHRHHHADQHQLHEPQPVTRDSEGQITRTCIHGYPSERQTAAMTVEPLFEK